MREIKEELLEALRKLDADTLRFLYDKYLERFMYDNSQVWKNLSFIVFLNLVSLFVVYLGHIREFSNASVVKIAIGIFSVFVGIIWLINAEVHRSFQNRHILYLQAIEETLIHKHLNIPHKIYDDKINKFLSGRLRLIWAIRTFVFIYVIVWIFLIIG